MQTNIYRLYIHVHMQTYIHRYAYSKYIACVHVCMCEGAYIHAGKKKSWITICTTVSIPNVSLEASRDNLV